MQQSMAFGTKPCMAACLPPVQSEKPSPEQSCLVPFHGALGLTCGAALRVADAVHGLMPADSAPAQSEKLSLVLPFPDAQCMSMGAKAEHARMPAPCRA